MLKALTREVSPNINACELTHLDREPIDLELARQQHGLYLEALRTCGCQVLPLTPEPDSPDSVFVEDTAVVIDEVAVITRPGASSRRPETVSMAKKLEEFKPLARIEAPGILDGGDVLRIGNRFFVGLSSRSNQAGLEQLRAILEPHGYVVDGATVTGCLHLKSAVTAIGEEAVLANPAWVDVRQFGVSTVIEVDPTEEQGANALLVNSRLIYPAEFPRTRRRLEEAGFEVIPVPASELAKAEGAVTCCSVVFS
jgi:dimethylargininase